MVDSSIDSTTLEDSAVESEFPESPTAFPIAVWPQAIDPIKSITIEKTSGKRLIIFTSKAI
jgi:hypothetical protein|tara:strand:- start:771 stop:953 length:183 start_codon:yes stop_codon:yes gene_type:complete